MNLFNKIIMKKFSVNLSEKVLSYDKKVEELTEKVTVGDVIPKKNKRKKKEKI